MATQTYRKKKLIRQPVTLRKSIRRPEVTVYYNPATGAELGREKNSDLARMPVIMDVARKAQEQWARLSFRERKKHILRIRDLVVSQADEIARSISENSGKTRIDALATEVIPSALSAEWYGRNAGKVLKPEKLAGSTILFFNKRNVILRQPLGVVAIISPWNYPFSIPFGEVIMGLAAGNAVLLKVSGATTKIGLLIRDLLRQGGIPDGLFHLLVGPGGDIVDAMLANHVDKIFFTGSTTTGREIYQKAACCLTPVSLELGGKDAMIVMDDADLERAANGAAWAGYQNAGQSCGSVERVYVHESAYDRFIGLLADKTRALRFGEDTDFSVEMGSMITKEQWDTVDRHVRDALDKGARIIAQSDRGRKVTGAFYPPLLMADVDHSMDIMRYETFGPVIPVMKFRTIDEAVRLANDSTMGLTASIWTRDKGLAADLAGRLQAGVITVNDHLYTHGQPETPWGGWKESGIGSTHSRLGLLEMTRVKLVNRDILPARRNLWWFPYDRKTYEMLLASLRLVFPKSAGDLFLNGIKAGIFIVKKMFTRWKAE